MRDEIENIVKNAIKEGVDPYLSLAINDIVLAEKVAASKDVKSIFCFDQGEGEHTIDKNRFWEEQYSYAMKADKTFYRARLGKVMKVA